MGHLCGPGSEKMEMAARNDEAVGKRRRGWSSGRAGGREPAEMVGYYEAGAKMGNHKDVGRLRE